MSNDTLATALGAADTQQQPISIPIPVFPPFKLRSSLIDKDPVIWEYLLIDYITLFRKLLALLTFQNKPRGGKVLKNSTLAPYVLTSKSISQLHDFLHSFLHESSLESTQVFSLGAINPKIRENQHLLKLVVFLYIKSANLINLKITGTSLWEFCKVYITMADKYSAERTNQAFITIPVIRKLVEGTVKSTLNSKSDDISLIRSLHDCLGTIIASGKWKNEDSDILYLLLGQKTKKGVSSTGTQQNKNRTRNIKNVKINDSAKGGGDFAEKFVNKHWINILEELYSGGDGVNADICIKIMIISLCSLTSAKLVKFLKSDLEIDGLMRLKQFNSLVAKVILSKKFHEMNPDLRDLLSSILVPKNNKSKEKEPEFSENDIQNVLDMFPQLKRGQVKTLIKQYTTVENIINVMLEMEPSAMENIDDFEAKLKKRKEKAKKKESNVFDFQMDEDRVYSVQLGKKVQSDELEESDEDFRKRNLQRALALLYDADEDEPDDTYADNELVTGLKEDQDGTNENRKWDAKLLEIESKLFGIYTSDRSKLERINRNTPYRRELRLTTGWTDEQLEGWARVLDRSPKRFRELEDRLVYVDGSLNKSGKQSSKWKSKKTEDTAEQPKKTVVEHKTSGNFKSYMQKKKEQKQKQKQIQQKQK